MYATWYKMGHFQDILNNVLCNTCTAKLKNCFLHKTSNRNFLLIFNVFFSSFYIIYIYIFFFHGIEKKNGAVKD